jgi:4-amino-4-deoxy-L-arabinose transferase-like glycosyltransferase
VAVALALCVAPAFFLRLDSTPFYRTMEAREGLVVQEMDRSGNWILPRRNGTEIPSKPPLFHWLALGAARLAGGVSEGTMRLPSAVASTVTVVVTGLLGYELFGASVAVVAGLMLATMRIVVEQARESWVDATFAGLVVAALAAFFHAYRNPPSLRWARWAFAAATAGAVLAKGPAGWILVGLPVATFLWWRGELGFLARFLGSAGIFAILLSPLLWYAAAIYDGGQAFVEKQLWQENLHRFLLGHGKRRASLFYFIPRFVAGAFPWSLLFFLGAWRLSRGEDRKGTSFLLVWWAAIFLFFSLSAGKREVYLLPLYPATALVAAGYGLPALPCTGSSPRALRWTAWALFAAVVGVAFAALGLSARGLLTPESPILDTLFGSSKWGHAAHAVRVGNEHAAVAATALLLLSAALGTTLAFGLRGEWRRAVLAVLGGLLAYYGLFHPFAHESYKRFKASKPFALEVRKLVPREAPLYAVELPEQSQIYFYLERHVPPAPCVATTLDSCPPGYYLLPAGRWEAVRAGVPDARELRRTSEVVLVRLGPRVVPSEPPSRQRSVRPPGS